MRVLVDTSVWSLALRCSPRHLNAEQQATVHQLGRLVEEDRVVMIGPIRQEILSGIRDVTTFDRLKKRLRAFPDEPLGTADYEAAADLGNQCRRAGLSGHAVDFLLAAVAIRGRMTLFTEDRDFERYATVIPLQLVS